MLTSSSVLDFIRKEIEKIIQEETKVACEKVKERIGKEASYLAVTLLKRFSVKDEGERIIIEVDNKI